jgi:hypothetical protein
MLYYVLNIILLQPKGPLDTVLQEQLLVSVKLWDRQFNVLSL